MTTLPSDYKDAPSFIKNTIEDNLHEKYDVNLFMIFASRESEYSEILKLLRKEYRRYRRHWRRLDMRQQRQRIEQRQRILNDDLPW